MNRRNFLKTASAAGGTAVTGKSLGASFLKANKLVRPNLGSITTEC